jgi:hypothetical protein
MQNASESHTEKREKELIYKMYRGNEERIDSYIEKKILSTTMKLWRIGALNLCRILYE